MKDGSKPLFGFSYDCPVCGKGNKRCFVLGSRIFEECDRGCGYSKERDDLRKVQDDIRFEDRRKS